MLQKLSTENFGTISQNACSLSNRSPVELHPPSFSSLYLTQLLPYFSPFPSPTECHCIALGYLFSCLVWYSGDTPVGELARELAICHWKFSEQS